jgi:undecaprenyl-diphosphatase
VDELFKAGLLGLVEGFTEFLPISSTGHLLVAADLLKFANTNGTFEIFIQFGSVIALLVYYAGDLVKQAGDVVGGTGSARRFWLCVLLAFLPAAVIGLLTRNAIKSLMASPTLAVEVVAISLIVGGIVFVVVEKMPRRTITTDRAEAITVPQALAIGVAQVFSLVPGVSRSGASIVGGMLVGLDRAAATRFSFYLAIPTLGAATLLTLATALRDLNGGVVGLLAVGTVVAGVAAFASIGWLLRYVAHNSFVPFGVYRIVAGVVILLLVQLGVL